MNFERNEKLDLWKLIIWHPWTTDSKEVPKTKFTEYGHI
jgi:hypothetical protein